MAVAHFEWLLRFFAWGAAGRRSCHSRAEIELLVRCRVNALVSVVRTRIEANAINYATACRSVVPAVATGCVGIPQLCQWRQASALDPLLGVMNESARAVGVGSLGVSVRPAVLVISYP